MNTSCRITYKDGKSEDFNSIEEAAEKTGISIASIKIRCNKPTKSFPKFEWLDEHTKRSYQAKRSKLKGSSWEYQVRDDLNSIGYNVVTAKSESKSKDNGKLDIIAIEGELPFGCQCKYTQNLPNYVKMRDECIDQEHPFCVMWKIASKDGSNSPASLAIIPYDFFIELLKHYPK